MLSLPLVLSSVTAVVLVLVAYPVAVIAATEIISGMLTDYTEDDKEVECKEDEEQRSV